MIDYKLFGGFGNGQTDRQTDGRTNERTFVVVESLSRLKRNNQVGHMCVQVGHTYVQP